MLRSRGSIRFDWTDDSIDGLRPDYVTAADKHSLKIPNLRLIMKTGPTPRASRVSCRPSPTREPSALSLRGVVDPTHARTWSSRVAERFAGWRPIKGGFEQNFSRWQKLRSTRRIYWCRTL